MMIPDEHIHSFESSAEEKIRGLIEQLDAYIAHYHGGRVEFCSFDGTPVKVRMGGACAECPLQTATIQGWVQGTIRQFFPDVTVANCE